MPDSRLFYRGMDIGTAKPTTAERHGVIHHLIDILGPHQDYSLSDFLSDAREGRFQTSHDVENCRSW